MNKHHPQAKRLPCHKFWKVMLISVCFFLHPILLATADTEMSCLERCIHTHPLWGPSVCSEGAMFYMVGAGCYEIQNGCFLTCNVNWNDPPPERYIPQPEQLTNQWRQEKTCAPGVTKIPLELLPGDHVIDPRWSGRCECLNGNLFIGQCGHKKASCDEVCDGVFNF